MKTFRKLFADKAGATAIEYGLIAALIAVAAIGAMQTLGTNLQTTFTTAGASLGDAGGGAAPAPAPAPAP